MLAKGKSSQLLHQFRPGVGNPGWRAASKAGGIKLDIDVRSGPPSYDTWSIFWNSGDSLENDWILQFVQNDKIPVRGKGRARGLRNRMEDREGSRWVASWQRRAWRW